jgi:Outer membrane protein beta-barrel domain
MHQRKNCKSLQRASLFFLFLLVVLSEGRAARAQADPTATRTAALSAFGGYTNSNSDYGRYRNTGGTVGVDYTRYFRWRVIPSLEIRGNYTTGPDLKQGSILFGPRLQMDLHRFHPYADVFYGGTKIIFQFPPAPGYTYDIASTVSVGGGVDIDVLSHFQAKIDYQKEFMNFGPNGTQPNNADFTLTPSLFTVGVVYRIPFRARNFRSRDK